MTDKTERKPIIITQTQRLQLEGLRAMAVKANDEHEEAQTAFVAILGFDREAWWDVDRGDWCFECVTGEISLAQFFEKLGITVADEPSEIEVLRAKLAKANEGERAMTTKLSRAELALDRLAAAAAAFADAAGGISGDLGARLSEARALLASPERP